MIIRIHHTGLVVRDIYSHYRTYMSHLFPESILGPLIHDPLQKVNAVFIATPPGCIELIEPASDDSPISQTAKEHPAGFHHVCLEVTDLGKQLQLCKAAGQYIVSPPQPAIAYGGRHIAFVMGEDRLLWELLDAYNENPYKERETLSQIDR